MIDLRRCGRGAVAVTVAMAMFPTTAVASGGPSVEAGASQSPIDIRTGDVTFVDDLPRLKFRYHTVPIEVVNTGSPDPETTIRGEVDSGATLRLNGKDYSLLQFHFHTTSEHRLDGEVFPMEMHLVHQAEDGEQLVVGVWIEAGDRNRDLAPVFADLPADETETLTIHRFDLDELIPDDEDTYRYQGSLTTPPFTEGVQWIVFDEPLEMSPGQISSFQALFPDGNVREPQPLNERPVLSDVDTGDLRGMKESAEQTVAAAALRERYPSSWSAGPAGLLACADLLGGRPAAPAARSDEPLSTGDLMPPEAAYTLHMVHGAARADLGQRPDGLVEMRAARAASGDVPVAPSILAVLAVLAVLEHRVALASGAAAEVAVRLGQRVGPTGETLLFKAWTEAAAGRYEAARTSATGDSS